MFQGPRDMIRGPFTADLRDGNIPSHKTNMEMNNTSTNVLGIIYIYMSRNFKTSTYLKNCHLLDLKHTKKTVKNRESTHHITLPKLT